MDLMLAGQQIRQLEQLVRTDEASEEFIGGAPVPVDDELHPARDVVRHRRRPGPEGVGRAATVEQRIRSLRRRMDASRWLHTMPKPTVAAVHGAAAGAGLSLALACDFRLIARSTKITTAFAKVALAGDYGGSWFLTRIVGPARARDLYLRPRVITADEALSLGIATEVVDDDALEARALAFARELAQGPRATLAYMKQNLNRAMTGSLDEALDQEALHHILSSTTEDHREAAAAFVEKREPRFTGR